MSNWQKRPVYNLKWAEQVVLDLWADAPRVTEFCGKALDISPKDLCVWLALGDRRWEIFKATCKMGVRLAGSKREVDMYRTNSALLHKNVVDFWRQRCEKEGVEYSVK